MGLNGTVPQSVLKYIQRSLVNKSEFGAQIACRIGLSHAFEHPGDLKTWDGPARVENIPDQLHCCD